MGNILGCVETDRPTPPTEGCATFPPPDEGLNESAPQNLLTSDISAHNSNPFVLTTRRESEEDASSDGVRRNACERLVGGRRARGICRKNAPLHHKRTDAAAFRTILSSQQEPLGAPRLFACEDTTPQLRLEHREGGLQALLRVTMEREAAMRQLAREKLPELHLLGAGETHAKVSSNTSAGSFINQKHVREAPHAGGSQVPTLLSSGQDGGAGPALTPNSRPRCESRDAEAPLSVIECTVEPPSCPNDGGLQGSSNLIALSDRSSIPIVLSDKDIAALRPPLRAPASGGNPLHPQANSQGTSTSSAGVASHRFLVFNTLAGGSGEEREHAVGSILHHESCSSPTTLYAQSSGGVPSTGARPSVSDAFGSHSQLTSRHSTMSSHQDGHDALLSALGSQNPLGLLSR
jgi:hypothetical protein